MLTMSTWDLFRWHETYWKLSILQSSFVFHLPFVSCGFPIVFFTVCPQHVSSVLQALSPPWVMSTNGGMFFLLTWRLPVLMSAIPSVTVWMVGVYGKACSLLLFLSILALHCVMTPMKWIKNHGKYLATISNTTLTATLTPSPPPQQQQKHHPLWQQWCQQLFLLLQQTS